MIQNAAFGHVRDSRFSTMKRLLYVPPTGPYDPFRVDRIGEDEKKRRPAQGDGGGEKPPKKGLAAYLLNLLKKTLDFLIESASEKPSDAPFLALKQAFDVLKKEDRSEDVQFLKDLSLTWQMILEASLSFDSPILKTLLKKIQNYPEWQEHTFGYYLIEYAGQKWIPFPYMELIEKLHEEHMKNPSGSALSEWTALIDELLSKRK